MNNDWKTYLKKQASQVPTGDKLNDDAVESAFADQAWIQIQNKVRPLAKEPYVLGFEIVWKNDANSKMIGIYAFRINKKLYYAPVFFINGSIKGTDLFYDQGKKLFFPATNEWADYVLGKEENDSGTGVDRKKYNTNSRQLNIRTISHPPITPRMGDIGIKQASVKAFDEMCILAKEIQKSASESKSILKSFIEDFGISAFNKVANTICDNYEFANQMHIMFPNMEWAPEEKAFEKKAYAAKPFTGLRYFTGEFNKAVPQEKRASFFKSGFYIEDKRLNLDDEVVYDSNACYSNIDTAGIYEIILRGGETKEFFVAPLKSLKTYGYDLGSSNTELEKIIIDTTSGEHSKRRDKQIIGKAVNEVEDPLNNSIIQKQPTENKGYFLLDKNDKSLFGPFFVSDKKTYNGITKIFTYRYSDHDVSNVIIINPDLEKNDFENMAFNPDQVGFIETKVDKNKNEYNGDTQYDYMEKWDMDLGSEVDITKYIMKAGFVTSSVSKALDDTYQIRMNNETIKDVSRGHTTLTLMKFAGVRQNIVDELLDNVDIKGSYKFIHKSAGKSRLQEFATDFFNPASTVNDFGTSEDYNREEFLHTEQPANNAEKYDNKTTPNELESGKNEDRIMNSTPAELMQLSQETGQRSVFEHGVVGQLARTYDASDMLTKYIPDLIQALDKIGRSLFLFYWKPEDFAERYGADDQADLENMFLSNFKSFGELVLELLQRNPEKDTIETTAN